MLAQALSPKFLVLYLFVISGMAVHFRGRVRFGFFRQLTSFTTFLAPINGFMYLFSSVPNRPFHDLDRFPELDPLREQWTEIRDEAMRLYQAGHVRASEQYDDLAFNSFFRRGWKRFYLKWYGHELPSSRELCPRTVALLEQIPIVKGAMFALLPPGGRLMRHRDPYAGSLRYHLGLITPNSDACRIWVDGECYSWRDGEAVLFDETFIHEAKNEADQDRIILFCDVERPLRFGFARAFNRLFSRTVMAAAGARNMDHEQVGILNRMFGGVYQVRKIGKQLKEANKPVYYLIKYAIFAGVLYLLLS